MTTSQTRLMAAISEDTIADFWRGYFQEGFRSEVHSKLLELFDEANRQGITRATIAKRIKKRPELITRMLSSPSNLECDTISDIALALGCIPKLNLERIKDSIRDIKPNDVHPMTSFCVSVSSKVQISSETSVQPSNARPLTKAKFVFDMEECVNA